MLHKCYTRKECVQVTQFIHKVIQFDAIHLRHVIIYLVSCSNLDDCCCQFLGICCCCGIRMKHFSGITAIWQLAHKEQDETKSNESSRASLFDKLSTLQQPTTTVTICTTTAFFLLQFADSKLNILKLISYSHPG